LARLIEIVRVHPAQALAVAVLIGVVLVAWFVESSTWRARHH
jgi:hypothetical protein